MTINEYRKKRFYSKVSFRSGEECWEWVGDLFSNGYGDAAFCENGKRSRELAHRFSYSLFVGPIESDKIICHTCDNRKCVNPNHLYAGSYKDNHKDMVDRGRDVSFNRDKTHCIRGHELSEYNLIKKTRKNGKPYRNCRICYRMKKEARRKKRREMGLPAQ